MPKAPKQLPSTPDSSSILKVIQEERRRRACVECDSRRRRCTWPDERNGSEEKSCLCCLAARRDCTPQDFKRLDKRRPGRILSALRSELPRKTPDSKNCWSLGPTSVNARLAREEMTGALLFHLLAVSVPFEASLHSSLTPNFADHVRLCEDFWTNGLHTRHMDPSHEILLWSSAAMGARRSDHSEIAGRCTNNQDNDQPKGLVRESACTSLAERAIMAADNAGVFKLVSPQNLRLTSLLRNMLLSVAPSHPFIRETIAHSHWQRSQLLHKANERPIADPDFGVSGLRVMLVGTQSDLESSYGWSAEWRTTAVANLRDIGRPIGRRLWEVKAWVMTVAVGVLRELHRLDSASSFAHQHGLLDSIELSCRSTSCDWDAQITMLPTMVEVFLLKKATALQQAKSTAKELQILVRVSECRFLRWLSRLIQSSIMTVVENDELATPSWRHSMAMHFEHITFFSGWVNLARDAADQNEKGVGPLSGAGFTRDHLNSLRFCLRHSANVFASAVSNLAILDGDIVPNANKLKPHKAFQEVEDMAELASELVSQALSELERSI